MKRRGGIWAIGWVLLGLLVVAGGLMVLGERQRITQPSADSYAPSGTHAFIELLRAHGYDVRVDRMTKPKLSRDDVALGFSVVQPRSAFELEEEPEPLSPTEKLIGSHMASGGRALVMQVPFRFDEASKQASSAAAEVKLGVGGKTNSFKVSTGRSYGSMGYQSFLEHSGGFDLAADQSGGPLFSLYNHGDGMLGVVTDATGALNRFIDAEQNAAFLLKVVQVMSPEAGRIVLVEALGGQAVDPGLLATIGSWALAAWWQLILLFIVIAWAIGRRFGIAEVPHSAQRGGRELVDAYADVMHRAQMSHAALKRYVLEADRELRRRFSISADLPPKRRNEVLPESLARALSEAELAAETRLSDSAATHLAMKLEDELAKLAGEPLRRRRRKR